LIRTREQLVSQRTELVNALRAHLYEFGHIAPHGIGYSSRLESILADEAAHMPDLVRTICGDLLEHNWQITDRVDTLSEKIDALSNKAEATRHLRTMPGIGRITALAIETFRLRWRCSNAAGILLLGLVWCRYKIRAVVSSGYSPEVRWVQGEDEAERHHRLNCGQRRIHAPTPPNWRQPAKPWLN
jgi:hypothetical protein